MKNKLEKGNIEDFNEASQEGIKLTILRKSYDKMSLNSINLKEEGSLISNCTFIEANFTGCNFSEVNFSNCDFSKASFSYVKFVKCIFFNCSFDGSKFNTVDFDKECTLNSCTFNGIDPFSQQNVTGIDEDNFKIIVEKDEDDSFTKKMKDLGFAQKGDKNFEAVKEEDGSEVVMKIIYDDSDEKGWKCCILKDQKPLLVERLNDIESKDEDFLEAIYGAYLKAALKREKASKE